MSHVQLFVTCLVDTFYPEVGEAVVNILSRLGVTVEFPPAQTCCGQPAFNAGLWSEARSMAQSLIRAFEPPSGSVAAPEVVCPSGSCVHMIRHNYPELFRDDPIWRSRAQALAARTYEFSEYLVKRLQVCDLGARWEGTLTYHPSCHSLRGLESDEAVRTLLSAVKGAQIVELPNGHECCGFGGVFSVIHPELSGEMLARKIENIEASGAATLVVPDAGCLMHIAGGLRRQGKSLRVVHLAEVLNSCENTP